MLSSLEKRDLRIDFFRGLALCMILLDHIHGDPLSHLTYHAYGFSDAAEIFVFLSGIACGISYSNTLCRLGWAAVFHAGCRRILKIYVFYFISGCLVVLIASTWAKLWEIGPYQDQLQGAAANPWETVLNLAVLKSSPADTGILALYILLTLTIVPLFLGSGRSRAHLALFASLLMWLGSNYAAQQTSVLFGEWYLGPFAWQFLFSIGLYLGMNWNYPTAPIWQSKAVLDQFVWIAWIFVAGAFLLKISLFFRWPSSFAVLWTYVYPAALDEMKHNLAALRIVHFLCVALLVSRYVRPDFWRSSPGITRPVIWCGQYSLELYSAAVVLDTVVNTITLAWHPGISAKVIVDVLVLAIMFAIAVTLKHHGQDSSGTKRMRH